MNMIKRASLMGAVVVSAISLVLSVPSCSKKAFETGWKADVEVVNGVKTIRNPETPRYGTFAFDLAEDLVIGEEQDERYFLPGRVSIGVDDGGTIFACDTANRRVQVFDESGVFIRTLGRQGQGPGEYSYPSAVFLDETGNAHINDARSLVVFDRAGTFNKNIPVKTFLMRMILGPGGTIVGRIQPNIRAEGGPKNALVQLGPDGEMLRTLTEFPAYSASQGQMLLHWYSGDIMTWPFIPQVIKGGFLYEVRQDEDAGLTRIIRHRIKNWGDFRSE